MIKTYLGKTQLPVNPLEDVTFSIKANNERFEIVAIGDVTKIGSRGLISVSLKSIFTDGDYPFMVVSSPLSADQYIRRIRSLLNAESSTRFIMTGDGVDINMRVSIEDFQYEISFGEAGEYYYSLSLMEYRSHSARRIVIPKNTTQAKKEAPKREDQKSTPTKHTAVAGDTLWALAAKYYGDGSQYMKIYNANKSLNPSPNHIYVGQVFVIP